MTPVPATPLKRWIGEILCTFGIHKFQKKSTPRRFPSIEDGMWMTHQHACARPGCKIVTFNVFTEDCHVCK